MSKTRETPCLYYICAGQCSKGREADHKDLKQKLNSMERSIRLNTITQCVET